MEAQLDTAWLHALIILSFATWRLSNLLVDEEGPWAVFSTLRYRAGVRFRDAPPYDQYGTNSFARGLICLWCVSVWIGIGLSILFWFFPQISLILALPFAVSAGAIIIDTLIGGHQE